MEDGDDKREGESVLGRSVLVLNRFYTAINIVSARRAICMLYADSAEAIDVSDGGYQGYPLGPWIDLSVNRYGRANGDTDFVRTARWPVMVPRIIRLRECTCLPKNEVKFTKRNVLIRDMHRCQYCGRRYPASKLTVDHVVPRSRGGRSTWTNVVTACAECNTRKGGKLPWEVGMSLIRRPVVPRRSPLLQEKIGRDRYRSWAVFLKDSG